MRSQQPCLSVDKPPKNQNTPPPVLLASALAVFATGSPAEAAVAVPNAVPSAFAAYGHYLALVLTSMSLVTERLLIKEGMTEEEFDVVTTADSVYGIAGLLILVTGYLRVTEYGKGWEFYQHEPIFWVKMTLLAVMGASSFFPTIKIIQRAVAKRNGGDVPPMSSELIARMTQIINAELLAVASIPLTATLMSRGVWYTPELPWFVGAVPVVGALGGLGFKYVKEALDWKEA